MMVFPLGEFNIATFVSDSRGLEVRGHGGGQGSALDIFLGDHHWHNRNPHGRSSHI